MQKNEWQKIMRALAMITQLGIVMIVNIAVGFFLGYLVDNWLSREVIFKIGGLIIGISSGFYSNYRLIKEFIGNNKDNQK